jgi:hypothetical protein
MVILKEKRRNKMNWKKVLVLVVLVGGLLGSLIYLQGWLNVLITLVLAIIITFPLVKLLNWIFN